MEAHATRARHVKAIALGAVTLVLALSGAAALIVISQQNARAKLVSNLRLRGATSAGFVAAYLEQEAAREESAAGRLLAARSESSAQLSLVSDAFGSLTAVLLDGGGRLLAAVPSDPALVGHDIAPRYGHLATAESGRVAVSNVVPSAVSHLPVAAVAVPYETPWGRRVFSAAYAVSGSALSAFIDRAVTTPQHEVLLVDGAGNVLAASPRTTALTLAARDPALARVSARESGGSVAGEPAATTFTSAAVPGTQWHLVIAVPDQRLFTSIGGLSAALPWMALALVSVLGLALVAMVGRLLGDRDRLRTLSVRLEMTARTDELTGLWNRRGLSEQLDRALAHARRHDEPLSVLMIDLDRFKEINDTHGHAAGDRVLRAVADCMRAAVRGEDVYGRWGGDEFLVALAASAQDDARGAAERLREQARQVDLSDLGIEGGIPMSIGSATAVHGTVEGMLHAADEELYRAKRGDGAVVTRGPG
jgi:diguanylate cyclase (GGDEF)-like protein